MNAIGATPARVPQIPVRKNGYLIFGGWLSLAVAVVQLSGIFWPAGTIKFLGGPTELSQTQTGAYALLCIVCGALAAAFGFYALSGAGKIKKLPLLRITLITATAIYMLRGLFLLVQLPSIFKNPEFWGSGIVSAISLVIGMIFLAGVVRLFEQEQTESARDRSSSTPSSIQRAS